MIVYKITIEDKAGNVKQIIIKEDKPFKDMLDMLKATNEGYEVKVSEVYVNKQSFIKKEKGDN